MTGLSYLDATRLTAKLNMAGLESKMDVEGVIVGLDKDTLEIARNICVGYDVVPVEGRSAAQDIPTNE